MSETWSEHKACARCGSELGAEFATSRLGVRFCHTCFEEAVEERERDRDHDPSLQEVCNRCHGSLINGYHANYMGVHFCTSCFERTHTPDGRPLQDWAERDSVGIAQKRHHREDEGDGGWVPHDSEDEEGEGVYLHDVFFITTILALVMYAMSRFGGALLTLGGY